jgi:hypothetical protein
LRLCEDQKRLKILELNVYSPEYEDDGPSNEDRCEIVDLFDNLRRRPEVLPDVEELRIVCDPQSIDLVSELAETVLQHRSGVTRLSFRFDERLAHSTPRLHKHATSNAISTLLSRSCQSGHTSSLTHLTLSNACLKQCKGIRFDDLVQLCIKDCTYLDEFLETLTNQQAEKQWQLKVLSIIKSPIQAMAVLENFFDSFSGLRELYIGTKRRELPTLKTFLNKHAKLEYLVLDVGRPAEIDRPFYSQDDLVYLADCCPHVRHLGVPISDAATRNVQHYFKSLVRDI